MKVPARIYADEDLLAKMRTDRTIQQCVNVAHLDGIQKYSIVMPDGHEGYGFPIGGVAATDYDEGLISPGGVGYDINCLSGSSLVVDELGCRLRISDFAECWRGKRVRCIEGQEASGTKIVGFLRRQARNILRVRTLLGHELLATEDHPFLTQDGMVPLGEVGRRKSKIAVYPFMGVEYEKPNEFSIVAENDILALRIPANCELLCKELKKRGLLPFSSTNTKLPLLLKIMGFLMGNGSLIYTSKTHDAWFYGKREDLEEIRRDLKRLGFRPSKVYSRTRESKISTKHAGYRFKILECSFRARSRSLIALLAAMGSPLGNKAADRFELPKWLFVLQKWQKRLFLASLFGADLSAPKTMTDRGYNFYTPVLGQNKKAAVAYSGVKLLEQIVALLQDFDVKAKVTPAKENAYDGVSGPSTRIRLLISNEAENLIRFWSTVGYDYNKRKTFLANVAVHYLKLKRKVLTEKAHSAMLAVIQKTSDGNTVQVFSAPDARDPSGGSPIQASNIRSITSFRIGRDFPKFNGFLRAATQGLGRSGAVWDEIASIEEVPFNDYVYDFTVASKAHNFIANGFVVSNCGVRLIRTNLTEEQVRPVLPKLVDTIFNFIPSGLGSKGQIRLSPMELDKAVTDGLDWAVDKGYAWPEDPKTMEEEGCLEAADPSKVSNSARSRGAPQLGSLGSGNHFVEVERADKIFDKHVADRLGIHKEGQILILIHTGSRGYGHQICSDYLRVMERAVDKYHIQLPDRELAACPSKSPEAEDYIPAMSAACNFAWVNRQMITHWARQAFEKVFGKSADSLDMKIVYDVAHNVAKVESHKVDNETKKVIVHRKGATRSFPPGHPDIPAEYRDIGQPVLIPGSMGTSSWVLIGTPKAMELSFGTTAHGAGRFMSRSAAKRQWWGADLKKSLESRGIIVRAASMEVVAEEAPGAYKDVDRVAEVSHQLGIGMKVVRMTPIGVAKG
jgi:tRNA-splicing ligase RtcB